MPDPRGPFIVGDRHEAALALYERKWPDRRIGAALGCCSATVLYWRRHHDLPALIGSMGKVLDQVAARKLHAAGASDCAIARQLGVSQSAVTRWRGRNGLPGNAVRSPPIAPEIKAAAIKLLLLGMSAPVLSKELGLSKPSLQKIRNTLGADPRLLAIGKRPVSAKVQRYASGRTVANLGPRLRRPAFLAYCRGLNDREIARELAVDRTRIASWRVRYGLPPNYVQPAPRPAQKPIGPAITPLSNDLFRRAAAAVGQRVAPDIAADAVSDLILAVLSGDLAPDRIEAEAPRYVNRVIASFASDFGPRSLDEEIGEDGFTLREIIPDTTTDFAFDLALHRGLEARRAAA